MTFNQYFNLFLVTVAGGVVVVAFVSFIGWIAGFFRRMHRIITTLEKTESLLDTIEKRMEKHNTVLQQQVNINWGLMLANPLEDEKIKSALTISILEMAKSLREEKKQAEPSDEK